MAASLGVLMALCLMSLAVAAPVSNSMCSVPKVYEATITITSGLVVTTGPGASQVLLVDGTFHADLQTQNKIAVLEHAYSEGRTVDVKVLDDFTAKIRYVIVPSQKVCTKRPLPQQDTQISRKVAIKGSQKLGLGDPLTVNVYEVNDTQADMYTRYYMTQKECLPVFRESVGKVGGTNQAVASLFSDLSLSIKDPSVFSIPDYCHQETPFLFGSQVVQDALIRHRSRRALWT